MCIPHGLRVNKVIRIINILFLLFFSLHIIANGIEILLCLGNLSLSFSKDREKEFWNAEFIQVFDKQNLKSKVDDTTVSVSDVL